MSLFVNSVYQLAGDTVINQAAWSSVDNLAALSAFTIDENDKEINQVLFSNNEGETILNSDIVHDFEATVMQWHPCEKVLCIGWADGMISTWLADGKSRPTTAYTNTSQHHSIITVMKWNSTGKRLVTGDKRGIICVWSADSKGVLSPMRQYKRKGEITQLVFCSLQPAKIDVSVASGSSIPRSNNNNVNDQLKVHNHTPSFFFSTDRGNLAYADDMGHCTDIHNLSSPIDVLLYFSDYSYLLLITRSLLLITYHISNDGKINKINSVKLSIQNPEITNNGLTNVVWINPGVFAMATEEKMLRIYDVILNEGYNLSLTAVLGSAMDRGDRVTCAAFDSARRYLSLGSQMGWVVIYKFVGAMRELLSGEGEEKPQGTTSSDWELIFKTFLNSPATYLGFHQSRGYLCVITEDQAVFLTESTLHSFVLGDVALIQVNSQEVHLQFGLGGASEAKQVQSDEGTLVSVNTGLQIRGIAMCNSSFVVWTNKITKVYRVDALTTQISPLEVLKLSCLTCVIADTTFIVEEVLFAIEANSSSVKVLNFHGISRGVISFSEGEGMPLNMHINNKFLAIITNRGCVKIFDVHTPTKAKLLGSAGTFHVDSSYQFLRNNDLNQKDSKVKYPEVITHTQQPNIPANNLSEYAKVRTMEVNCTGNMVAILIDRIDSSQSMTYPDSNLYVYNRNKGSILTFNFLPFKRTPIKLVWDENDERLLCCEANCNGNKGGKVEAFVDQDPSENEEKKSQDDKMESLEVYLLFATAEKGIIMQDSFPLSSPLGRLIGFCVPHLYFKHESYVKMLGSEGEDRGESASDRASNIVYDNKRIVTRMMRDFVGIDVTEGLRSVILDFSYFMVQGKLDDAYRVIKDINSPHIWENMAQMCVKTRRLDVAEVCLSHMGHIRGIEIIEEYKMKLFNDNIYLDRFDSNSSINEHSNLVIIGILAIQLGLLDDAVAIFKEARRFDLLNNLYQNAGQWQKAIQVAESSDRMHLKTTYYNYAQYLEHNGSVNEAIEFYRQAEVDHVEVPRMLFYLNRIDELNEYIIQSDNMQLLKWWASYLESIDRMDKAKKYYAKAKDYLSLVRIACFKGDFEGAAEVINESGDRASSYHFARQLEHQNEFQEAINFYALAGCFHHCIRLAKAHELDGELMRYALKSTPAYMISSAEYYEQKGEYDKAIQLYYKGQDISYALELCFRIGEEVGNNRNQSKSQLPHPYAAAAYDMINTIAQELGVNSSPQLLARCADFLVSNKQYAKAIELYIMAKKHFNAIEICIQYKIPLNDDIVEQLTPKEDHVVDVNERKEILKQLGKLLKKQGLFMQASRKYTQAGDRVQAIKCLVKHGDNKLIIQFANISRNREIYILAANYLQQMNWREDIEIMKFIIMFYSKAKAYIQLSNFYEHCATVEIDDYQDYSKAVGAYNEAMKYLHKLVNEAHTSHSQHSDEDLRLAQQMSQNYQHRIMKINKFLEAKKSAELNLDMVMTICDTLLQDPDIDEAVRVGDIYSLLVERSTVQKQYSEAYRFMQDMQNRSINLNQFLEPSLIEEVLKGAGVGSSQMIGTGVPGSYNEGKEEDSNDKQAGKTKLSVPQVRAISNGNTEDEDGEGVDEELIEEEEEQEEEQRKQTTARNKAYSSGNYGSTSYNSKYRK